MKKSFLAFLFLLFVFTTVNAQEKNLDTIVHKIFNSLKNKDEVSFVSLFPDYGQMKRFLRESMIKELGASGEADSLKINMDSLMAAYLGPMTEETYKTQMQKEFSGSFHTIIKEGERKGIVWKNTVLTNYSVNPDNSKEEGFNTVKGVLDIKEGNKEYKLAFDQMVWLDKEEGWFGVNLTKLVNKGESLGDEQDTDIPPVEMELLAPTKADVKKTPVKKTTPAKVPATKKTVPPVKPKSSKSKG